MRQARFIGRCYVAQGLLSPRGSTRQDLLTLPAIPPQALNHRLGHLSTLHRFIDRYRVRADKRSGIVNDPNQLDDPQYVIDPAAQPCYDNSNSGRVLIT